MSDGNITNGLRSFTGNDIAAPPYTKPAYKWDADLTLDGDVRLSQGRYKLEEYYKQAPLLNTDIAVNSNLDFEVLGTNMTSALSTFDATRGAIRLTTAGADNDQGYVCPHLDTKQTAWTNILWGTENQPIWEAQITTGDDISTGVLYWAGLKLTYDPTVATDDDQVFFRFSTDDADTNWEVVYSIGGTDTTVDSGVAVAADTQYNFRITIDDDRIARFYINDTLVSTSTALTDDVDLIPYIGVQALSGTAEFIRVHYQKISRILFE